MKSTNLFILLSLLFLSSCNFVNVRVRTIKDNDIIIIDANKNVFKGFKVGDTIQISKMADMDWELENDVRQKDGLQTFEWIDEDSTKHFSWCDYKTAIIEEFVK